MTQHNTTPTLAGYQLLNEIEAAKFLGLSRSMLQKHRIIGDSIPFVKIGKTVRYKISDLIKYVEENTMTSTSETAAKLKARRASRA